jgi:hypothetical protein
MTADRTSNLHLHSFGASQEGKYKDRVWHDLQLVRSVYTRVQRVYKTHTREFMKADLEAQVSLPGTHGHHGMMKKVVINQLAEKDVRSERGGSFDFTGPRDPGMLLCAVSRTQLLSRVCVYVSASQPIASRLL